MSSAANSMESLDELGVVNRPSAAASVLSVPLESGKSVVSSPKVDEEGKAGKKEKKKSGGFMRKMKKVFGGGA